MVLAGRGLGGGHSRPIRAVEDQPDYSFYSPRDQAIDHHCEHGREFEYHAAGRWRTDQSGKWEQEQVGKPIDQGNDRAIGIGPNQLQSDAKRNERLKDAEQQPDQLCGFKSKDALFAFRVSL